MLKDDKIFCQLNDLSSVSYSHLFRSLLSTERKKERERSREREKVKPLKEGFRCKEKTNSFFGNIFDREREEMREGERKKEKR